MKASRQVWDIATLEVAVIPALPLAQFVPGADASEVVDVSCLVFVLQGPQGVVLVDTGPDIEQARAEGFVLAAGRDELVGGVLALGHRPEAVTAIIHTHLHYDHAQNDALFPEATIYVQRSEISHAQTHPDRFYTEAPGGKQTLVVALDGDAQVVPGIDVVHTAAHTPGHQAVVVQTATGAVCLAGDEVPLDANRRVCPPTTAAPDRWRLLVDLAAAMGWQVVPSHDPAYRSFTAGAGR